MLYKKRDAKRREKLNKALVVSIIALIALGVYIFQKPSITGQAVLSKQAIYSENLDIKKNESGTYEWQIKNPGNIKSLKVTGRVSANGTARVYIEKDGERKLLFDSAKQLFDVNINVLPEYKKILQGEKILIQNVLFNLRGFGAGDVSVRYSIKDEKGNVIATQEESVYIETQAKFIRELVMPPEIKAGTYVAFVEAFTNGTIVGTGSDTFEVKAKFEEPYYKQLKFYLIVAAGAIALLIAIIFGAYGIQELKKKKDVEELKAKEPLERIKKLENELNALNKAFKSGFISEESYKREKKRIEEKLGTLKNDGTPKP